MRVSMIPSLAGWPLLAIGVGALFGRTAAIVAVVALLVPGVILMIRAILIIRRRTPEQQSDVDDLRRAYPYTVSKLKIGRFISLGLIAATVAVISYSYAADIGPETNPNANGWIGVAFFVLAFGFLAVGMRIIRRDRRFRRAEPELWKRISIWAGGGGDYFLRRQLMKAALQHWITGKEPVWHTEDDPLRSP
jgi:hypothetical protein